MGLAAAVVWLALLALPGGETLAAPLAQPAAGHTFTVNSTADVFDFNPGDGKCDVTSGSHICTLRAAVQEVDAGPGGDTIRLQPNTTYRLTQPDGQNPLYYGNLDITESVTLLGAGPESTIIDGNGAVTGERVFDILTGTVTISGVTIQNGKAQNVGGDILNDGLLTLLNSRVLSGTVDGLNDWGGGIASGGALTVTGSLVSGNQTGAHNSYGGGLMNYSIGLLTVIDSTVSNNLTVPNGSAGGLGGGISGQVRVVNSTISGNTGASGGGLYATGNSVILNSTISGNHATAAGGGLYLHGGGLSLYNVTVADNLANSDSSGSGDGGGVAVEIGTFNFLNSILDDNNQIVSTGGPFPFLYRDNCAGTVNALGFDLLGDNDNPVTHCTVSGTPSSADPLLGPLQANGGPTLTMALLPGSPAIDAGNPGGCDDDLGAPITSDQRGAPRPANLTGATRCDIGAYEVQRTLFLPMLRRS